MSAVTEDWKAQARELRESGLSEREVAGSVGKAASTVHAFLKREGIEVGSGDPEPEGSQNAEPTPEPPPGDDAEREPEHIAGADRADAEFIGDNPHLTPFQREKLRLEAEGGQQGRIGGDGDVEWESESAYTEHLRIDGTTQIALDLGGKRATSTVLKLRGRSIEVDGSLRNGDRIKATIEIVVRDARTSHKVDKPTGIVVEAVDKFEADIADLKVISS